MANLEILDSLTWVSGLFLAALYKGLNGSVVDSGFMILLCFLAIFLQLVDERSPFRPNSAPASIFGLIAVPAALAAVSSESLAVSLLIDISFAGLFIISNANVPTIDIRFCPMFPLLVTFGLIWVYELPLISTICCISLSYFVLSAILIYAPKSFTLGESFMVSTLAGIPARLMFDSTGVVHFYSLFLVFGVIIFSLSLMIKRPIVIFLIIIPLILAFNDYVELFTFLFSFKRILLLGYCAVVCILFLLGSVYWTGLQKFPQIIQRKFFHIMALLVFVPPVFIDCQWLCLAISGAIFVFLFIESLRLVRFPYVASLMESYVEDFIDERDKNELILTHLFLLMGCGLPVLITNENSVSAFYVRICGICVLCIGDAAASVVGVNYGKHKWPGSKKSYEGTFGAFIGTWISMLFIYQFKEINFGWKNLLITAVPAFIGAIDEAFTSQIDNLTLPFVMIPFLIAVDFFLTS